MLLATPFGAQPNTVTNSSKSILEIGKYGLCQLTNWNGGIYKTLNLFSGKSILHHYLLLLDYGKPLVMTRVSVRYSRNYSHRKLLKVRLIWSWKWLNNLWGRMPFCHLGFITISIYTHTYVCIAYAHTLLNIDALNSYDLRYSNGLNNKIFETFTQSAIEYNNQVKLVLN